MRNHRETTPSTSNDPIEAALIEDMRRWRRHLHAHPELGFQEYQTTAFIRSLLEEWDLPYDAPLDTGTVAHVRGEIPGPVLLIRADIDALPIQEENRVAYASTNPGVMHGCGHDGHTAILLGLAKLLATRDRSTMRGEIRLVFQPAEELAPGGAVQMVQAGVLDGVHAAAGLHLRSILDTGIIAIGENEVLASDDRFDITITGQPGHAGAPHQAIDALVIAAGLVGQLQTLVSRRVDPLATALVTVGSLHAGEVYNAIAGQARLSGSVRALDPTVRDLLETELSSLTKGFAAAHQATAEVTYHRGSPPLINHPAAVEFVQSAAQAVVGPDHVINHPARTGAEDFAYFSEQVPSVYAFIGAGNPSQFGHHHPRFDIDEHSLTIGLEFFDRIVRKWTDPTQPIPDLDS